MCTYNTTYLIIMLLAFIDGKSEKIGEGKKNRKKRKTLDIASRIGFCTVHVTTKKSNRPRRCRSGGGAEGN